MNSNDILSFLKTNHHDLVFLICPSLTETQSSARNQVLPKTHRLRNTQTLTPKLQRQNINFSPWMKCIHVLHLQLVLQNKHEFVLAEKHSSNIIKSKFDSKKIFSSKIIKINVNNEIRYILVENDALCAIVHNDQHISCMQQSAIRSNGFCGFGTKVYH